MIYSFNTQNNIFQRSTLLQNNFNLHNQPSNVQKHSHIHPAKHQHRSIIGSSRKKLMKKTYNTIKQTNSNKNTQYYLSFSRTPQQLERQEQNCQNYFLRKTIMTLYKFFQRFQFRWNLYQLNYSQLLAILQQLHYIRLDHIDKINEKTSSDLKKCYWIWVNISEGKHFSLCNLIIILFCIQNLEYERLLIEDIVRELTKGIQKFEKDFDGQDSKYIFFVKNQHFRHSEGFLQLNKTEIERIQLYLKDLRFNRLMENHPYVNTEKQSQLPFTLLSKRSEQLAQTKRQKILREIKQNQPHVQQIQLYHLLNYKTNKVKERTVKTQNAFIKKEKKRERYRNQYSSSKTNTNHPAQYLLQQEKTKKSMISNKQSKSKSTEKHLKTDKSKNSNDFDHKSMSKKSIIDNKQSIELQFDQFYSQQLKKVNQKQIESKFEIVEQLEWQQIPKVADQMKMQFDLLQSKDDFTLCQPLSHTFTKLPLEKQRKRKEYIDLPILFVDVNIQQGKKQRIVIYQGDKARDLALDFGTKYKLNDQMVDRLQSLLQLQIGSVLTKIDELNQQDCSQLY